MPKIRAGTLRHKILIQRAAETTGTMGSVKSTWNNIKTTRASIKPTTGNEWFVNENIVNDVDHFIMLRKTNIVPSDRIIYNSRIFNIVRVLDDEERRNSLLILAKERIGETLGTTVENILNEDDTDLLTEDGENLTTE